VNYLRQKQLFLILDNFEHLLDESVLVSEILNRAPDVKILATSRARLMLQCEWPYEIEGLSYPAEQDFNWIESGDNGFVNSFCSVDLFTRSAQRAQRDFTLKKEDYLSVARITQLVGGMPLGLELAASWVNILSCKEIALEIEQSIDFLESNMQDSPERQRSIRAVFDYSMKMIKERGREIFPKLSVFCGGFSREAAQQTFGVTPRDLMEMVGKSLVQRNADGRFDLHPL